MAGTEAEAGADSSSSQRLGGKRQGGRPDAGVETKQEEDDEDEDVISRVSSSLDEDDGRGRKADGRSGGGGETSGPGPSPSSTDLLLSADARLLAVMSNASVLRSKVLPSLMELYRPLLTGGMTTWLVGCQLLIWSVDCLSSSEFLDLYGTPPQSSPGKAAKGEPVLVQATAEVSLQLGNLVERLLSMYLERKKTQLTVAVWEYLAK